MNPPEPVPAPVNVPDLRLRGDPPSVMRVSRKALITLGAFAGVGVAGSLLYALRPVTPNQPEELYQTEARATADTIASAPKDYGQVPRLGAPLPGDLGGPILSAQQRGEDVTPPPIGDGTSTPPMPRSSTQNAGQTARQRAQQERDAARTSKLFLGSAASAPSEFQARAQLEVAPIAGTPTAVAAFPAGSVPQTGVGESDQAGKRTFLATLNTRTASHSRLDAAASPYLLQAGSIIPAALITGIRSDLPGQVTAQVTQNIYDSATGRHLLIPQGARLIGEYDSQISFAQNRVLLAWDRLILPGGRSLDLERLPATDAAGAAGLQDRVNHHWGSIARAALLSTLLSVGAQVGSDDDRALARAIRDGGSESINRAGQQLVRRQLNVAPTLAIRPGYPVRVLVARDLVLSPIVQDE